MRIYTEVIFEWDDKQGKLVETSSESFDYKGELMLFQGGGSPEEGDQVVIQGQTRSRTASETYWTVWTYTGGEWVQEGEPIYDRDSIPEGLTIYTTIDNPVYEQQAAAQVLLDEQERLENVYTDEEFDPYAKGEIEEALKEFKEIITPVEGGSDDEYEQAVIDAVEDLDLGLLDAQKAMTDFSEELGTKWGQYVEKAGLVEDEYAWDDTDNDGIIDEDEIFEDSPLAQGEKVYKEGVGDAIKKAYKDYQLKEDPLAAKRDAAIEELNTLYGDPFIDINKNNMWDEGEPFGKTWVDDGDNIMQAGELQNPEGADYEAGTEYMSTQEDYLRDYRSIYGSGWTGAGDDKARTFDEALQEGIIISRPIDPKQPSLVEYVYADTGEPAPSREDWLEGSYYTKTRTAEETRELGLKATKVTREEALESLRTEAKEKIRSADAKRGAAGFAATGVGGTARDILAKEIGKGAREIEKAHTEGRELVQLEYTGEIEGAETVRAESVGDIEGVRDEALQNYYQANIDKREAAESTYRTSEAAMASDRTEALEAAASAMHPETGQIAVMQADLETGPGGAMDMANVWQAGSEAYRDKLRLYGATGIAPEDYTQPFEVEGSKEDSIRKRAEARLGFLAESIELVLEPMQQETLGEGIDSPFFLDEEFDLWGDPRSPFYGHELADVIPWTTSPGAGHFTGLNVGEGLFDPGEKGTYDPGSFGNLPGRGQTADPTSWLYQPDKPWGGFQMPWYDQEDWDPFGE